MGVVKGFTIRPTVDADYLLKNYSNSIDAVEALVRELISLPNQHDYMRFEIRSLEVISEIKDYQPRDIVLELGIDPDILGECRVNGLKGMIRNEVQAGR